MIPFPRIAITDKDLGRPNWLKSDHRDPNRLWLDKNENTDPEHWARVRDMRSSEHPPIDPMRLRARR
jgi:histidinol-phosphate aminotransferase